ncbi:MAG: YggT family protein [Candidatus Nanopelagicaceae bacterium]|nr:YggT family protein [Candidatus Nanopelagicaceae bacterium]
MGALGSVLHSVLQLFIITLIARLVLDYVQMFARNWRPKGIALVLAEFVFTITEKPLVFVRKFVPPLRVGSVNIDLAFVLLFFGVQLLMRFVVLL